MQEIKKVGVLSYAKIAGALGAVIGFIIGLILALVGTAMMAAFPNAPGGLSLFVGVVAIIVVPIVYGIIGFIGGAIVAFLYNLVAGWIGGVEIELV